MGSRGGDTREKLKQYLQFRKDNPGLGEAESVEKFAALVENEASVVQMRGQIGEGCTFPERRNLQETEVIYPLYSFIIPLFNTKFY